MLGFSQLPPLVLEPSGSSRNSQLRNILGVCPFSFFDLTGRSQGMREVCLTGEAESLRWHLVSVALCSGGAWFEVSIRYDHCLAALARELAGTPSDDTAISYWVRTKFHD